MKINIPNDILVEAGIVSISPTGHGVTSCFTNKMLKFETIELSERVPESVTGAKYPIGVVIYVKEDGQR